MNDGSHGYAHRGVVTLLLHLNKYIDKKSRGKR